jgi:polyisoprenoid-binding protein YceI
MKKKIFQFFTFLLIGASSAYAQDIHMTRSAKVSFYSSTPIEDISAENKEATAVINKSTGEMQFAVLIKSFKFEKALMEEHFNENFMESSTYPKADFKGKITNLNEINFSKDGTYKTKVSGNLTMHGVTKPVATDGTITIKGGKISAQSKFNVKLDDYKIERKPMHKDKISDTIEIRVDASYEPKK